LGPQKPRGEQRREREGYEDREERGEDHRQPEGVEELADDALHERYRREHDEVRQRRCGNRNGYL
jgi:hypothetical protein